MFLETFVELLLDPNHWGFEIVVMLLFDVLIGALAWPAIKRHIHKDVDVAEEHEHDLIARLEQRLAVLEGDEEAILKEVREGRRSINWAREKLGSEMVPALSRASLGLPPKWQS